MAAPASRPSRTLPNTGITADTTTAVINSGTTTIGVSGTAMKSMLTESGCATPVRSGRWPLSVYGACRGVMTR